MAIGIMIFLLVILVVGLFVYNMMIHKKVETFKNINNKISNLNVLQDFIDTTGKDMPGSDKIKIINDVIIEKFNIKYSTIVVFNGAEYELKTSNVDERHHDALTNLQTEEMFKESIMTATPKYITVTKPDEKLAYQKMEMGRAKSAMFFPLYIDNIYIGYWIIESGEPNAFDGLDTSILNVVKENIVSVLKSVSYQNTIENIYRVDKTTKLNSGEYLYGNGKRTIDKYTQSSICMFTITNIELINAKFGRSKGTETIVKVSNKVKTKIFSEYVFVRYMGPKFVVAFSGADMDSVVSFVDNIKKEIEDIKIYKDDNNEKIFTRPKTNFVISTYYKGTSIDTVTKKLEGYLDEADKKESNINCI